MKHPVLLSSLRPDERLSDRLLAIADAYRKPIFIAIVVLYLLGFNGQWRPEPDAALYLSIGRNLAEGKGYSYHGEPHQLAYPGLPWLWAVVFKATPEHAVFVAHVLMLAMGFGCLALCYRLFYLHVGRAMAVWVTLGLAISRMFYRYVFELRSDVPFLLGVLAFLCGFEAVAYPRRLATSADATDATSAPSVVRARWYDWLLMIGGLALAVIMRPTMWALLGAAVFATVRLLFLRRARWALAAFVVLAVVIIGFIRLDPRRANNAAQLGQYEQAVIEVASHGSEFVNLVFKVNIPGLFEPAASEAMFGLDMGVGLNTIGSIVAIGIGLSLFRYRFLWGMFYLLTVLMMIAVLPRDRYFLAVLPLVIYGWWQMLVWVERRLPPKWNRIAFLALLFLGSATNFPKVARWVFEQHQRPFLASYKRGEFTDFPKLGETMNLQVKNDAWVLTPPRTDRILTFYSDRNIVNPAEMGVTTMQVLAGLDRAYVLNPAADDVRQWLSGSGLGVGPAIETLGTPQTGVWTLHKMLPKRQPSTDEAPR